MLENMGFVFKLGETVEEIIGKESEQAGKLASLIKGLKLKPVVQGVKLKSGSIIKADAVLFSAGVRPDLSLAFNKQASPDLPQGEDTLNDSDTPNDINNSNNIDTNLLVDKGIVVNERMETSLPSVYAAGDTAEYQGVNFCIWTEAMAQGRAAGINMAGGEAVYKNIIPSHIVKVAGISVASAGYIDIDGKMESEIISNESVYKKIVKDNNGKTAGCIMVGDTADFNKILHQIKGE
ncbi:FAD-dependent pyridine nucleotide-disulfide oxidoreductase, nirB [Candidatus Magnetoovum chiemensis]|nr:FAD-dependent pyridine nucleotide-disulfide oxidoreductase, nirB [Candidatus Magnetoovum chiemensis]